MEPDLNKIIGVGIERLRRIEQAREPAEEIQDAITRIVGELEFLEYINTLDAVTFPKVMSEAVNSSLDIWKDIMINVDILNRDDVH